MARIIYMGEQITPETAMKWFCWHELIAVMEKDRKTLNAAIDSTPDNVPDWEMEVFKKFLETTKNDLIII